MRMISTFSVSVFSAEGSRCFADMLFIGHGVYDTLTKRLDEVGDPLCLILVVRISTDDANKKPLKMI